MSIPTSRILDLVKKQCHIFSSTYNPLRLRTGNNILRQRLKGPSIASYYPRRLATYRNLVDRYPGLETWDEDEEDRLEHIGIMKGRGKGAPKKRRTREESKKIRGGKRKVSVSE